MLTTHGACGTWWWQSGNHTSHCSGCHQTFASLSLFDAHFNHDGDRPACTDPRSMEDRGGELDVESKNGGGPVWYSPAARARAHAAYPKGQTIATASDSRPRAAEQPGTVHTHHHTTQEHP